MRNRNGDPQTNSGHPEELLAAYAEGSVTDAERRAVDAHLASCARCWEELDLSRRSRAALATLEVLPAPGLAAAGLDALLGRQPAEEPAAAVTTPRPSRLRRRLQWDRLALGAGLAAAAGLFVFFAASGVLRHSPSQASKPGSANQATAPVIQRGASYSPQSMQALADQLLGAARKDQVVSRPASAGFAAEGPLATTSPLASRGVVVTCLRDAAGIAPSIQPIYLEAGTFQGTPAWIGAFVIPPVASAGRSHLLVIAAGQNGCQPLYVVRQAT
jgi:anti-sigma factor RsiW